MKVRKVKVTKKAPAKPKTAAEIKAHNTASATAKRTMAHRTTKQKHASAMKAAATRKKDAAKAKRLGWAPDGDVPICTARAVAESLRLALGVRVRDRDVLALHEAAGGDRDAGASILDVLRAAQVHGLAGHRPVAFACIGGPLHEMSERLIIGGDMPEPHAVLATADGWWSWGDLFEPWPDAVVEEAWQVTW